MTSHSNKPISPSAFCADNTCKQLTMATALRLYTQADDLEPHTQRLVAADVRQAFVRYPAMADLNADGHSLRQVFKTMAGNKRTQNIRSSTRLLLSWVYKNLPRTRQITAIGAGWASLLVEPSIVRNENVAMMRLARYCSIRNLGPADVSDTVMSEFFTSISCLGTVTDLRKFLRRTIRAWNSCSTKVSAWPKIILILPPREGPPQRAPSLDAIGGSLADQIAACLDALSGNSQSVKRPAKRFDLRRPGEGGPAVLVKLEPSTIDSYSKYLRRSVRVISEQQGRPYHEIELKEVINPATAEMIMNTISDELSSGGKSERSLHLTICAIYCVAKNYFRATEEDLAALRWLGDQVERPEPKMTIKNFDRLRRLVLEKRHALMRLPAILLNRAISLIKAGKHHEADLVDGQVAVAIAVLLSIPIRESNLAAIRLGVHLTLPTVVGAEGRLQMPATMVKNKVAIDRYVPVDVVAVLRAYIKHVLPLVRSNPESKALFPGRKDNSTRGAAHLGTQVARRIKKHLGIEMNLHLFRHFAAISYLEVHPGEYEVVRLLLGNRNLEIVKAYYTGVEQESALRKAATVVAKEKESAGLNSKNMLLIEANKSAGRVRRNGRV